MFTNNIEEYDIVRLKYEDKEIGIKTSYTGVVINAARDMSTVEFFDENGETIEASIYKEYNNDDLIIVHKHYLLDI